MGSSSSVCLVPSFGYARLDLSWLCVLLSGSEHMLWLYTPGSVLGVFCCAEAVVPVAALQGAYSQPAWSVVFFCKVA
jgi:hypothetical protein